MQEGDRLTTDYYNVERICTKGKRPVEEFIDDLIENSEMEPIADIEEIQLVDNLLFSKYNRVGTFLTGKYESYKREGKDISSRMVLVHYNNGVDILFLGLFVGDNTEVKADNLGVGVLVQKQEQYKRETIFVKNKEGSFVPISEEDRESVNDGILIELNKAKESLLKEDKYEIELREKLFEKLGVEYKYIGMFGDNNVTFARTSLNRYKLIDKEGNELSTEFASVSNFSEGVAAVQILDGKYGYIRPDATFLKGVFESAYSFSEGLAAVQNLSGKFRYIRLDGTYLKGEFKAAHSFSGGLALVKTQYGSYRYIRPDGTYIGGKFEVAEDFSGELALVKTRYGKYRYMRSDGTYLKGGFKAAHSFSGELAVVKDLDGKCGYSYIRPDGTYIGGVFESAEDFSGELAVVQNLDGKFRYIRPDGTYLKGEFKAAHSFSERLAVVQALDGKFRYMRPDGTYLEGKFKVAHSFSEGVALVQGQNGEWRYIDHNGRQVFKRKLNH